MTARRPIPDVRWRYFSDSVLASLPFAKVQRQNTREIDWPGATDRMALLEGHAAVQYRECIYVFGGRDNVTGRLTNAVWQIPLGDFATARDAAEVAAKLARQRAATVSDGSAAAGVEPSGSLASPGGPPAAVDYAAATGLPTVRGTAVGCSGHVPSPCAFHASCARGHFMLVGGVTAADRRATPPTGRGTTPRCGRTCFSTPSTWTRWFGASTTSPAGRPSTAAAAPPNRPSRRLPAASTCRSRLVRHRPIRRRRRPPAASTAAAGGGAGAALRGGGGGVAAGALHAGEERRVHRVRRRAAGAAVHAGVKRRPRAARADFRLRRPRHR